MKKLFKNPIFTFILGAVLFGTIGVYASSILNAEDVVYNDTNVKTALDELYTKVNNPNLVPVLTEKLGTATYSGTYNITGLTVGHYYLIFQTMIDNNQKCGLISGGDPIAQTNAISTGKWKETYGHGKVMLVKATSSTIVIGNSGTNYTTLSKATVIDVTPSSN